MTNRNILMQIPQRHMDLGHSEMTDSGQKLRQGVKANTVTLFGRQRAAAPAPAPASDLPLPQIRSRDIFSGATPVPLINSARAWASLNAVVPDEAVMAGNGLFPRPDHDGPAQRFDLLRTQILHALADRGWSRIGVTAPRRGAGASFVAANLALSFARRPDGRTVIVDLDLRHPALAMRLGLAEVPPLRGYLLEGQPLESQFLRFGSGLALGLNGQPEADPASVLHARACDLALDAISVQLEPGLVIFDLPPLLEGDEVLSLKGQLDAVILVSDGTSTSPAELTAAARLLDGRIPILAVLLNRGEDAGKLR